MGHTKTQQKVLATLRGILRLVRATVDSRSATDPLARDVSLCVAGGDVALERWWRVGGGERLSLALGFRLTRAVLTLLHPCLY